MPLGLSRVVPVIRKVRRAGRLLVHVGDPVRVHRAVWSRAAMNVRTVPARMAVPDAFGARRRGGERQENEAEASERAARVT